jgi:AcrR family transcriptional regulator
MARLDVRGLRHEQILDAAQRLVLKHGWAEVTFARLCEEADVTNGVLTYHFKDKDDIEQALWERVHERWFRKLEERFASAVSVREVMNAYTREALAGNDADLEVYYLLLIDQMARAMYDPEVATRLQAKFARSRRFLETQLERFADVSSARDLSTATTVVRAVQLGAVLSRAGLGIPRSSKFAADIARLLADYLTDAGGAIIVS